MSGRRTAPLSEAPRQTGQFFVAGAELEWREGGVPQAEDAGKLASEAFDPNFREAWTISQIAAQLQQVGSWLDLGYLNIVGEEKQTLCAFALNRFVDEETVELLLFAVAPGVRGQGLGRQLLSATTAAARNRGASTVFLEVRSSNHQALGLYESFGFVEIGKRPAYYQNIFGEYVDALTLSLSLD